MIKSIVGVPAQPSAALPEIIYPDSDGQPMADNTEQFDWIVTIKLGLEWLYADNPDVFVAGDLLWYPVEGDNKTRAAPDVFVAVGRPKGPRGSYMQWRENGVAPQVVFEIQSPGNTAADLERKFQFYDRFRVEEYYLYDPDERQLSGWRRVGGALESIENMNGWVSPRLSVRFELVEDGLHLYGPDSQPFISYVEMARRHEQEILRADQEKQRANQETQRANQETQRANQETQRANQETQRANQETQRANQETQRAERLAAQLRALGIEPQ